MNKIERDESGLIKGLDYKYTEENLIDWRALVPTKYLYLKNDIKSRPKLEKKYGKSYDLINITEDKVEDNDLIISLAGLKYIGRLRGISDVREVVNVANEAYASVTSLISYIPNIESEMLAVTFSASASATLQNTTDFYQKYLVEAASNRAFARNIRAFCNINIVSREELGKDNQEENNVNSGPNPQVKLLQAELDKNNVTWEQFKHKLIKDKVQGAENMKELSDLPNDKIFEYLERLKSKKKNKKEEENKE